ncbi:ATP-binding protein [Mameliella alba]|uniref:ATP-binding protein n=1 Tax=Mameliella alba TaxID=561184 RepID=UPI000B535D8F|nr:ATP-binding protein [Mameliella alba]OWV61929.1 transcriptional regulator [Mameliella alba]
MEADAFLRLIQELRSLSAETAWAEFKENNANPEMIGETVSALSNAAALSGKDTAWLIWGIRDGGHAVVGTSFNPAAATKGNQNLESWLVQMLSPRLHIEFHSGEVDGLPVVALEIPAAQVQPTAFYGKESLRVGSVNRALKDVPQMEAALWRSFDRTPFEKQVALADQSGETVIRLLDYPSYFDLLSLPLPSDRDRILAALADEDFVRPNDAGHWDITNLGAILFARDLTDFAKISRKAVRLIVYEGRGRLKTKREQEGRKGYAVGFEGLMDYLKALLPRNEVIGTALRAEVSMYPDLALRELIANAMIHQDFSISGAGPMVEVFDDRIEVTNPGVPLGDIDRLLDQAPRSRNEALAAFMRRIGVCEERGSGVDKVVAETEFFQLPPPRWETSGDAARAILFAHKDFRNMDKADRIHACYLHACLKYVMREELTNTSLRERFGLDDSDVTKASRVISSAVKDGVIKPFDPAQGNRNAKYVPFWA